MSLLITGLVLTDQFSKGAIQSNFILGESIPVIDGLFNITYVRNFGAAWSIGATSSGAVRIIFLLLLPVLACFWLVSLIWSTRKGEGLLLCVSYSLILAGAIGNLIDRFSLGYVVDFLDFYWGRSHFPTFNVADTSISVAVGLIILDSLRVHLKKKRQGQRERKS